MRSSLLSTVNAITSVARLLEAEGTRRYPEWKSRKKTKGRKDRSLKSRTNRRK